MKNVMIFENFEKKYNLFKQQYNKVRDVINSVKTIEQWESAKRMLKNLSKWWVSDGPVVKKPFDYKYINEPLDRIGELERLLFKKKDEIE